jgi:hypothetical protein
VFANIQKWDNIFLGSNSLYDLLRPRLHGVQEVVGSKSVRVGEVVATKLIVVQNVVGSKIINHSHGFI